MDRDKRELEKTVGKGKPNSARKESGICRLSGILCQDWFILIGLSLLVSLLLSPTFITTAPHYELGDVADRNIKADHDFLVEDEEPTTKKRAEVAQETPIIYDYDETVEATCLQRMETAFAAMRQLVRKQREQAEARPLSLGPDRLLETTPLDVTALDTYAAANHADWLHSALERKQQFEHALGCELPDDVYRVLVQHHFSRDIQDKARALIELALRHGIVANKPSVFQAGEKNILVQNLRSGKEFVVSPPQDYWDLPEAQQFIKNQAAAELSGSDPEVATAALYLGINLIQPNLTFNRSETENLKQAAMQSVKPVFIQLKRNEMLVREGQKIGAEELAKLRTHQAAMPNHNQAFVFISLFMLTALSIRVFVYVAQQHLPAFTVKSQDLLFLAILFALLLTVTRCAAWLNDAIGDTSVYLNGKTLLYAVPVAAGAMFSSIFFGVSVSLIFSLLLNILVGMLLGKDFQLFLYFLVGSFVAAHSVASCRNRMAPIRAGILVGCTNMGMILLAALLEERLGLSQIVTQLLCGFGGGVFAGILVTGLTPVFEMAFGYTTDIKLLELASMDQPLLQELMVQAPGTYHHSVIVSNMVEAAAKAIGANSLLAKVAAYYHDIGKIKKSLYFIENQFDGENRHEKLAPSMSSLILIAHVKDGVELARAHRLGKPIVDIISQHHGTRLISFFYQKAQELREKTRTSKGAELPPIDVDNYRYPGPKPQTKEAGLVMLADVVEAACRALPEPTSARIQGLVNKLINNIFSDGQLDECELTLKDLHQIAKRFNQILATIHHKRIEYPAPTVKEAKSKGHADSAQRDTKADRDRPAAPEEGSKSDLKRLGLH